MPQPKVQSSPLQEQTVPDSSQDEVVLSEAANPKISTFRPNHTDVYKAALSLCAAMAALNIPCAVAGGVAVSAHGYQRSTRDVDVIVSPEGLEKFKDWGVGRGWVNRFKGSRNMRDNTKDVGVDIILTTDRPVTVPSPELTVSNRDGLPVLPLPKLIELKLATAKLNEKRKKDLRDVSGLIQTNELTSEYAQYLDPSVRDSFLELC